MQPYFLPYIGYFQLIGAVDLFVIYDNIKYTKKGWINRNRMLQNGKDVTFSLPLHADSDHCHVRERQIAGAYNPDKLLNLFGGSYRRAPNAGVVLAMLEGILRYPNRNLFDFLHHAVRQVCAALDITTEIRVSSTVPIDHELKGQEKVLALCTALGATSYVNAIGGVDLYSTMAFRSRGLELRFLRSRPFEYPQPCDPFVPWLSIIDAMFWNKPDATKSAVHSGYDLVLPTKENHE